MSCRSAIISDLTEMFWFFRKVWHSILPDFGYFDQLIIGVLNKHCSETQSCVCVYCAYSFYFLLAYLPSKSKFSQEVDLFARGILQESKG